MTLICWKNSWAKIRKFHLSLICYSLLLTLYFQLFSLLQIFAIIPQMLWTRVIHSCLQCHKLKKGSSYPGNYRSTKTKAMLDISPGWIIFRREALNCHISDCLWFTPILCSVMASLKELSCPIGDSAYLLFYQWPTWKPCCADGLFTGGRSIFWNHGLFQMREKYVRRE